MFVLKLSGIQKNFKTKKTLNIRVKRSFYTILYIQKLNFEKKIF